MTMDGRLQIQFIAEKILRKHDIDPASESYYLKLRMPNYDDLVIEKDGERWKYPRRIKDFRSFQSMFANNIKEQGWFEDGVRVT